MNSRKIINVLLILSIIFLNLFSFYGKGTLNVIWDTKSGQSIEPGATINVSTIMINLNRYDVNVSLSFIENYTIIPDNEDYITQTPAPDGTWSTKFSEYNFILKGDEEKNIIITVTAPMNAVNDETYGFYISMYVENLKFHNLNENDTYVFSATINMDIQNNNTNSNETKVNEDPIPIPYGNDTLDNNDKSEWEKVNSNKNLMIFIVIIFVLGILIMYLYNHRKRN